ncbi:MAG: right-handed parallel beta-helix repeat-containing protein [Chloroflexi bacterium HGW-Chloroflexi-6]|nr:MAG: right-handed parallel beta-helix repeat-containing protein [Chloroflexi bacterium HGW-Chloroflexi-6]
MTTRALPLFLCLILLLAACSTPAAGTDSPAPAQAATEVVSISEQPAVNAPPPSAEPLPMGYYDPGDPAVTDLWVDPLNGDDNADGLTSTSALQTLDAAWRKIPSGQTLTGGYRIRLQPGEYPAESIPNYWESRYGSYEAPVIIQGQGSEAGQVILQGFVNVFDSRYLYFENLSIITHGDAFHCEKCDHLLIRNVIMYGFGEAHEVVKVNQSQYVFIESSDLSGTYENVIDFVGVQYGHILRNHLHDADDWCAYVKGGSAYIRVEGNEMYNCGTGGFTAGQGTGFQFMSAPWLTYEAYDIRVVNNIIHDTEGAGLGVNGGYNILMAYNTLYRVGSRSHGVEIVFGMRSCDGQPGDEGRERCQQHLDAGGWGTTVVDNGENFVNIGNQNVFIYNNILYNPAGFRTEYQHFAIYGPRQNAAGSGLDLAVTDANLQIKGNIIWNGDASMALGIEDASEGCQPVNLTCNASQLLAENSINSIEPVFADPSTSDFTPTGNWLSESIGYAIPDFAWDLAGIPAGQTSNAVTSDAAGNERSNISPGAVLP